MITLATTARQKLERILANRAFTFQEISYRAGYEWGYLDAENHSADKIKKRDLEIKALKEKIRRMAE